MAERSKPESSGRGRPWIVILAVLLVGGGAAAVIFVDRRGNDEATEQPSTTVEGPEVSVVPESLPNAGRGGRRANGAEMAAYQVPDEFAVAPTWDVFVVSPVEGRLIRIDLASGDSETVDTGIGDVVVRVVSGAGGSPVTLKSEVGGPPVAATNGGSAWAIEDALLVRRVLIDGTGDRLEEVRPTSSGWQEAPTLIGTTAEGRPIVVLPDNKAYAVDSDGSLRRFADGRVDRVEVGQYAEALCSPSGDCSLYLHGRRGTVPVTASFAGAWVEFSSTGTYAAVFEPGKDRPSVRIFDLATGRQSGQASADEEGGLGGRGAWSPDGRYLVFVVDGRLRAFDSLTSQMIEISLTVPEGAEVVGVA